jgi:hypothetical protein
MCGTVNFSRGIHSLLVSCQRKQRYERKKNCIQVVVEKPAGERSLGRPRRTWHIAVKMDPIEIGGMQAGFMWLRLRGRWRDFVNTTTIFQVLGKCGEFFGPSYQL